MNLNVQFKQNNESFFYFQKSINPFMTEAVII